MGNFQFTWYNLLLVFFISLGGLTYGFGFGVFVSSIGQPGFYAFFNLDPSGAYTASILGAVNSLFAFGAAIGAILQGWVSDRLGRQKAIAVAATLSMIGGALTAGSVHIAMLIVVRLLWGLGLGMIIALSPLYIAEISPPRSRGLLVGCFAVFFGLGYVLVAWISLACYYAENETVQWRLPIAISVVPPISMLFGVWYIPESPRWLVQHDRSDEARVVLERIHRDPTDPTNAAAHAEFVQVLKQVDFDKQFKISYVEMFRRPSWRWRSLLAIFVLFANQSTGVLGIGNFAVLIYQSLGMTGSMPILMNAVYTTSATLIGDVLSSFLVDRIGRRRLMLVGYPSVCLILLAEALLQRQYIGTDSHAGNAACVLFLFIFIHVFDVTVQVPSLVFISEIWPTAIRPGELDWRGAVTSLELSPCCVVSTVIVYLWVPETANKTLEEMGDLFGDEVVTHMTSDGRHLEEKDVDAELVAENVHIEVAPAGDKPEKA